MMSLLAAGVALRGSPLQVPFRSTHTVLLQCRYGYWPSVLVMGNRGIVEEGEEGRAGRARRKHAEFTLRQERGSDRREKRRKGKRVVPQWTRRFGSQRSASAALCSEGAIGPGGGVPYTKGPAKGARTGASDDALAAEASVWLK